MLIVAIDDNEDFRHSLSDLLSLEQHTVLPFESGTAALAWLRQAADLPDLVMCDQHLDDEMHGLDVLASLRNDARLAAIPYIFMTADPKSLSPDAPHQPDAIIKKPFEIDNLFNVVRSFA